MKEMRLATSNARAETVADKPMFRDLQVRAGGASRSRK